MKILYGIQGTGNGHITRARHLAHAFQHYDDITVDYCFSGRKASALFDMDIFKSFQAKRGMTFITENGRINHVKTILNNNIMSVVKDIKSIDVSSYDLVLNDFEPITAWAAKRKGIPSISVSHQASFLYKVPTKGKGLIDKVITSNFAPTTFNLGTHWYHFGHPILPPFVAQDLVKNKPANVEQNSKILVYLPFESLELIREQLLVLSDWDFICYHPSLSGSSTEQNITWHAPSSSAFKKDLVKCSGVLSNCGYELSTECLSLGIPLIVKPLQGQFEQLSNAYTLETLGLCRVIHSLNSELIDDWLQNKSGIELNYPTNCNPFIDWLKKGNWERSQEISDELWSNVNFPTTVKDKISSLDSAAA